ncbi:GDSL-type esterase/lipase family protein [Microbacteriaceae bacterium 4G12]
MKRVVILIVLILFAIGFFCSTNITHKETASSPHLWLDTKKQSSLNHLILGDSLAKGYGSTQGGYAEIASRKLQQQTGKEILTDNIAVNGLTTDSLLRMLQGQDVQEKIKKADIITISIGGNNLLRLNRNMGVLEGLQALNDEKGKYKKNLEEILTLIRQLNPSAMIVMSELYNPLKLEDSLSSYASIFLDGWNKTVHALAEEHEPAIVLPIRKLLPNDAHDLFYDKVHPNDKGYEKMADHFVEQIISYRVQPSSAK